MVFGAKPAVTNKGFNMIPMSLARQKILIGETPHGVISVVGLRAPADVITRFNSVLPRFSYFSSRDFETLKKYLPNASLDLGGGEDLPFPTSVRDQRFPIKNSVTFITTGQCQVTTGARNNIFTPVPCPVTPRGNENFIRKLEDRGFKKLISGYFSPIDYSCGEID